MSDGKDDASDPKLVTSESLSTKSRVACWVLAVALLGSGGAATFFEKPGAAAAALIALGGLLTIIALMGRIPLRLEVAGATLDASYPTPDQAYDAGREGGRREGLQAAVKEVKELESDKPVSAGELAELIASLEPAPPDLSKWRDWLAHHNFTPAEAPASDLEGRGWTGPAACNAARITYRQLDYWARTGLIEPSGRSEKADSPRLYVVDDVVLLAGIRTLLDAGISLKNIRTLVASLREHGGDLSKITVASDGDSVYETTRPEELTDLVASGKAYFTVSFAGLSREVRSALLQLPSVPLAAD